MVGLHESPYRQPVVRWIDERFPIFTTLGKEYLHYPMPKNANYMWSFGGMALVTLIVMILSGLFLSMFYVASTDMAFASVERIMRDVQSGWLVRYIHMNGASMFFVVVFIHMLRGLYYGSYKKPRELLWMLGVVILLLLMATAFMGYVLPWGQMSYWGATVITNLFSVFPIVGDGIVTLLWGGFTVDQPTLNRFFSLHYLLPFVILAVVFLHVVALHITGSNNPKGIEPKGPQDTVPFHPYMTVKDSLAMVVFLIVWAVLVFFMPNVLGHPDNYIPANPLSTPAHIVPEWYFLAFYAMLRAIPNKLGGVVVMFSAVLILFVLPWLDTHRVRSGKYRPLFKQFFWLLVAALVLLAYVGSKPPEGIYVVLGRLGTIYYFAFFLVILPLLGKLEKPKNLPESISEPVLPSGGGGSAPRAATAKPEDS